MATETITVEQLIDPLGECLTPDVARRIIDLRADAKLQARVDELADKANVGTITAQKVYTMLGNESLWDVAARCHELLSDAGIAYYVCVGVAVCLHRYQRNTTGLDLVIRSEDSDAVRRVLTDAGFKWDPDQAEFQTADGIIIQFLVAVQKAGKGTEVSVWSRSVT
ncbi:hypothetical protein LF1_05160 [Rubripirellula obstinata]|uniref:Nucleotidyltransferase n=1 Tax=Rubripirellula obstinata TaxID=406547 RepID=A0A5B1CDT1_9BACT|nr:hypothetical protein [Rubripirellula obstinata]KAA1258025.1 hypothetical protein LF1_05160 [Rubripirellula obstinata]